MLGTQRLGRRIGGAGIALGAALVAATQPAAAQDSGRWLPYLGCWQATEVAGEAAAQPASVCFAPGASAAAVEMITVGEGRVSARRTLTADGQRHNVSEAGCTGWEQAVWSEDGQRLYLRSELTCEGGTRRLTSGAIAMATPSEWLDVQTVEAGGYPIVRARRFRPASEQVALVAGVRPPADRALAVENARTVASQPLSVDDVKEASRELSAETLELLLFERGGVFEVDAAALVELADAGVPDRVIDVLVALAYPDVFAVNSEARNVGYRPEEVTAQQLDESRRNYIYDRMYYDPYSPYGYGYYNRYGYAPFGYGDPWGWRHTGGPVIIIRPPVDDTEPGEVRGPARVVKGRGYTRGRPVDDGSSSTSTRGIDRSSTGASSAAGSSTGSSGSSSSGRTAKKRGGG